MKLEVRLALTLTISDHLQANPTKSNLRGGGGKWLVDSGQWLAADRPVKRSQTRAGGLITQLVKYTGTMEIKIKIKIMIRSPAGCGDFWTDAAEEIV